MRAEEIRTLFEYNTAANQRILAAAAALPPEALAEPADVSHGSLLGTLAHVFAAEWTWRMRAEEGVSPSALPGAADFPSLAALRDRLDAEDRAWEAFLAGVSEDDLARAVPYTNTRGARFETPFWQIALHVVNHGTQFRAEAAVLLTRHGASPGDLDLIAYLRTSDAVRASTSATTDGSAQG